MLHRLRAVLVEVIGTHAIAPVRERPVLDVVEVSVQLVPDAGDRLVQLVEALHHFPVLRSALPNGLLLQRDGFPLVGQRLAEQAVGLLRIRVGDDRGRRVNHVAQALLGNHLALHRGGLVHRTSHVGITARHFFSRSDGSLLNNSRQPAMQRGLQF